MQRKHIPLILGTVFLAACGQGPDTNTTETTAQAPATETPAVAAALPAGVTLVETFDGDGAEIAIPYS